MNTRAYRSAVCFGLVSLLLGASYGASANVCLDPVADMTQDAVTDVLDVQCTILAVLHELSGGDPQDAPGCLQGTPAHADVDCSETTTIVDALLTNQLALNLPLSTEVDADGDLCPNACEEYELRNWAFSPCGGNLVTSDNHVGSFLCAGWASGTPTTNNESTIKAGIAP